MPTPLEVEAAVVDILGVVEEEAATIPEMFQGEVQVEVEDLDTQIRFIFLEDLLHLMQILQIQEEERLEHLLEVLLE